MANDLQEQRSDSGSGSAQRSEPMHELEQVADRMRRLFAETFGGLQWLSIPDGRSTFTPSVDVEETDDEYMIEADLPGVKREDVNVELVGNELEITGKIDERERNGTLRRRMRRTGRFAYRVALPRKADGERIDASLTNGVLTVRIPKAEQEHRTIEIKS